MVPFLFKYLYCSMLTLQQFRKVLIIYGSICNILVLVDANYLNY